MGYTHYWDGYQQPVTVAQWNAFCDCVQKCYDESDVTLCNWSGEKNTKPEANKFLDNESDACIAFNGLEDDSHESFNIPFQTRDSFNFCKTARKSYDKIVVAVLTLAHHTLGLNVSSDGWQHEWTDGVDYLNKCLGTNFSVPENIKDKDSAYD